MKTGFIGLGIMGEPMAANLQKAGFDLTVYNRSADKANELVEQGASLASDPAEVGKTANVIFTMLSTPDVVREMAKAFLPEMAECSIWVDISTVNPSFSREMASLASSHGVQFVDAPVAGSRKPAGEGELLFLAGGKEEELENLKPFLEAMGRKTLYLGETGNGANVKMLINLLLAQAMATFSEAIKLGKHMGLDEALLLNIITATPVVSPIMGNLKERLLAGNHEVNFPLKWIHKDIMLALDTAAELSVDMPSLEQAEALYKTAKDHGLGDLDFTAVYQDLTQ